MNSERNCTNCGYVERERDKGKPWKCYCTNCDSKHCSEWVDKTCCCEHWVEFNESSKYYYIF